MTEIPQQQEAMMAQIREVRVSFGKRISPVQYQHEELTITVGADYGEQEADIAKVAGVTAVAAHVIKTVVYESLGLKLEAKAPEIDFSDPNMTNADIAEAVRGEEAPKKRGRPRGSTGTPRKSKAEKDAELAAAEKAALEAKLPGLDDDVPAADSDEDALMALLQGDEAKPAAAEEEEIDNAVLMAACAQAAADKKGRVVLDYLKKVGKTLVLKLDQAERRDLLKQLG